MSDLANNKIHLAKVIELKKSKVVVNANLKCLYFININEFSEEELQDIKGKEISVYINNLDPLYNKERIVSHKKAKSEILWGHIIEARKNKSDIKGKVLNATRGGFNIALEIGINAFLPTSHINDEATYDSDITGKTLEFRIIGINKLHKNVIISRKEFVLNKLEEENKEKISVLSNGVVLQCIIKGINNNALFVSVGYGYSASIISNEAVWGCDIDLSKIYHVGQKIEAIVYNIEKDTKKIALSINKMSENPILKIEKGSCTEVKPIRIIKEAISDSSVFNNRHTTICKTIEHSLMCRIASEDDRFSEEDMFNLISEGKTIEINIKGVDVDNRIIIGSTKRKKEEIWKSFVSAYESSFNGIMNFKVKGKSKFMLFLGYEDFETFVTINEVDYINTMQTFASINIGDSITCKIVYIDHENQKVFVSRRVITDNIILAVDHVLSKRSVKCRVLYRLSHRKMVILLDDVIEVVTDVSRITDNTLASIQEDMNHVFEAEVDQYQNHNYHFEINEHKFIRDIREQKQSSLNIKDIKIEELIDNFSSIISEIEGFKENDVADKDSKK